MASDFEDTIVMDFVPSLRGVEVHFLDGSAAYGLEIPQAELDQRQSLVNEALAEQRLHGSSFAFTGDHEQDRSTDELLDLWLEVARWDDRLVVSVLRALYPHGRRLVLFPGRHDDVPQMAEFSVRQALAVVQGGAVAGRSASFLSMPVWGGAEALRRVADRARRGLPDLRCPRVTLVLLPVPDRIAAVMTDLFDRHGASGLDEEALLPGLRQSRHTHILRANLRSRAEASGAEVFVDSTCQELHTILCRRFPPTERRALVLIGHQETAGIMCSDGFLPLDVLRRTLQDERPGFTYHSADLAVCHVNEPDNLAEMLQQAGSEVVFCRGQMGFFGRAYRSWINGFDLLAGCGPLSLPALVERLS